MTLYDEPTRTDGFFDFVSTILLQECFHRVVLIEQTCMSYFISILKIHKTLRLIRVKSLRKCHLISITTPKCVGDMQSLLLIGHLHLSGLWQAWS